MVGNGRARRNDELPVARRHRSCILTDDGFGIAQRGDPAVIESYLGGSFLTGVDA